MVFNKVYKAFFHFEDFLHWAHEPDQIFLAMFMLVLEIGFERALYLYDECYKSSDDYDLPQPLNKSMQIYTVPSAAHSFLQAQRLPEVNDSHLSINPKMKTSGVPLHWPVSRWLNLNNLPPSAADSNDDIEENFPTHPLMTQFDLKNLYLTETCASIFLQTNQKQVTHPKCSIPALSQESINDSIIKAKPMDSMDSDIFDLIDIPEEVLFQDYL